MNKKTWRIILFFAALFAIVLIFFPYFAPKVKNSDDAGKEATFQRELADKQAKREEDRIAEEKKYLTGKFDPSLRPDFVSIPKDFTVEGNKIYLRKETYEAFLKMAEAAKKDSVDLKIASATRNFDYQKNLWDDKWSGDELVEGQNLSQSLPDGEARFKKILEYSAVPGASRHHWGTDIDINNVNPSYFNGYKGKTEYNWLVKNAVFYGFCQTYDKKGIDRPAGYNEEKWHWSYLPLARNFTEEYKKLIKNQDISGFSGDDFATKLDLIDNYVLAINPKCN